MCCSCFRMYVTKATHKWLLICYTMHFAIHVFMCNYSLSHSLKVYVQQNIGYFDTVQYVPVGTTIVSSHRTGNYLCGKRLLSAQCQHLSIQLLLDKTHSSSWIPPPFLHFGWMVWYGCSSLHITNDVWATLTRFKWLRFTTINLMDILGKCLAAHN